jgi:hypothetical protein
MLDSSSDDGHEIRRPSSRAGGDLHLPILPSRTACAGRPAVAAAHITTCTRPADRRLHAGVVGPRGAHPSAARGARSFAAGSLDRQRFAPTPAAGSSSRRGGRRGPVGARALLLAALLLAAAPALEHAAPTPASVAYGEEAIKLLGLDAAGPAGATQSFSEALPPSRIVDLLRRDREIGVGRGSKKLVYTCACLLPDAARAPGATRAPPPPYPPKAANTSLRSAPPPPPAGGAQRARHLLQQEGLGLGGAWDSSSQHQHDHHHHHQHHSHSSSAFGRAAHHADDGVWGGRQGRSLLQMVQANLADPSPATVPSMPSGLPKLHRCGAAGAARRARGRLHQATAQVRPPCVLTQPHAAAPQPAGRHPQDPP